MLIVVLLRVPPRLPAAPARSRIGTGSLRATPLGWLDTCCLYRCRAEHRHWRTACVDGGSSCLLSLCDGVGCLGQSLACPRHTEAHGRCSRAAGCSSPTAFSGSRASAVWRALMVDALTDRAGGAPAQHRQCPPALPERSVPVHLPRTPLRHPLRRRGRLGAHPPLATWQQRELAACLSYRLRQPGAAACAVAAQILTACTSHVQTHRGTAMLHSLHGVGCPHMRRCSPQGDPVQHEGDPVARRCSWWWRRRRATCTSTPSMVRACWAAPLQLAHCSTAACLRHPTRWALHLS
jgi:hypothetical protein